MICRNDAGSGFDTKPELAPFESRREFAMISLNRDNDRMRITDIRETSIALNSTLKNSSIDFSEMTTSV
ncbi:MAG: hypothetical protein V7608_3152, partial [Hyphomicrobiales bacterium]